jgi:hypothetical protein
MQFTTLNKKPASPLLFKLNIIFPPTNVKETQGLSPLEHHQKHCSETEILHIPIGKVTHSLRSLFDYQLLQVFSQPC